MPSGGREPRYAATADPHLSVVYITPDNQSVFSPQIRLTPEEAQDLSEELFDAFTDINRRTFPRVRP